MPNLNTLIISNTSCDDAMIDAYRWEHLITSSLPDLVVFKFKFYYSHNKDEYYTMVDKFKEFQSDFWQEQHHWYTEYIVDEYEVRPDNTTYSNNSINIVNIFDNVTDLTLIDYPSTKECQYYFSKVTSLILSLDLTREYFEYRKSIVNLKHLGFDSSYEIENSLILLELLKETPQLLSLSTISNKLVSFLDDSELCKYLNKMIKQLNLHGDSNEIFSNSSKTKQSFEIFINIEHLQYESWWNDDVLFLIRNLPKLSTVKATILDYSNGKNKAQELNIIFDEAPLSNWIYYGQDYEKMEIFI